MTGPGDLSRRLVLEAPVETPDGAGGVVRGYSAVRTVWASLEPVSARRTTEGMGSGALITHRLVVRAGLSVTTRHRFRSGDRVYQVLFIRARDARFIEIDAEERAD